MYIGRCCQRILLYISIQCASQKLDWILQMCCCQQRMLLVHHSKCLPHCWLRACLHASTILTNSSMLPSTSHSPYLSPEPPHSTWNSSQMEIGVKQHTLTPIASAHQLTMNISPHTLTQLVERYDIAGIATTLTASFGMVVPTQDILTDQTNTFWEPIQTDRYLRLAVTNVTSAFGIVCWHLQLYGCVAPQGKW